MKRTRRAAAAGLFGAALIAGAAALPGAARAQGSGSATLDAVKARGQVVCGVSTGIAGFSLADSKGEMHGIDSDYCKLMAAAVLGDANKVKYVPTTTTNRFTALQSGEIDMLVRDTTWTLGREANLGLLFAAVNFYDGTGFMVKTASKVTSVNQLDGATVCVEPGTSTELAIDDYFRIHKLKFTPVLIADLNEVHAAFLSGRCDTYSTDGSQLASFRAQQPKPEDFTLLPEIISKEPLGVMVRKGDDKWFDLARWEHIAVLTAEEYGITSQNVDTFKDSTNPNIRRLLGLEGDMGKALGVGNDWAYNEIKQVGNYGEIYQRNIAPLAIPRGLNKLWNDGGLQYAPPIR